MSTRCAIGAVLLVLCAVATPVFAQSWTDVCSNEGRFCVLFPKTPTEKTDTSNNSTTHLFILTDQRHILMMGYTNYQDPVDLEGELQANRDNFLKAAHGTLVASRRTQFERAAGDWLPALEFSANIPDYSVRSLVIMDEQRVYMLAAATSINSNDFTTSERFLNSLRLKPRP